MKLHLSPFLTSTSAPFSSCTPPVRQIASTKLDMEIDHSEPQISIPVQDYEASPYASDAESSSFSGFEDFVENGMVRLEQNTDEHIAVEKAFMIGMGLFSREIDVVAVHKNSCSSIMAQAKMEAFRIFRRAVADKRGGDDANVKYGWYIGGDRDEIHDVVRFGFSKCGEFEKGVSHGVGVYLSPANVPISCALRAKEDENGLRHVLLCRVILGNTETICAGSEQYNPSSTNFDSGIDNPLAPRKYIIWSAYMNSHILPSYIISFRAPSLTGAEKPNSPCIKFPVLLNVLSRFLNPSQMSSILNYYNDFREHKIGRPELIRRLRISAGDNMLSLAAKLCRDERV